MTAKSGDVPLEEEDDALVRAAAGGDADALETLLRRFGGQVAGQLRIDRPWQRLLDPEDVMQVTYLEAFLQVRQLQASSTEGFLVWLRRIAENNLRDAVKELKRRKRPDERRRVHAATPEDSFVALCDLLGATSTTPSRHAARNEIQSLIESAIASLPESYARAVQLYDLQGLAINEVAAAMKRSPGAVHMLRARAHDHLRQLMGESGLYFASGA